VASLIRGDPIVRSRLSGRIHQPLVVWYFGVMSDWLGQFWGRGTFGLFCETAPLRAAAGNKRIA